MASVRISSIVVFLFASSISIFSQNDEVISVDSSMVVMSATISDATGRHVAGLSQRQFRVFEDGIEQKISLFTAEETPFAAVILLDTSGSIEERISMARAAAARFLQGLRATDNAAVFSFEAKTKKIQDFSNSRDIADKAFDLKSKGQTALNDAIFEAAAELSRRPEKRRAIIVLSDGADTISRRSDSKALKAALDANALIYAIDMTSPTLPPDQKLRNQTVLKRLSTKTGGTFVATPGGATMRDAFKNIAEELGLQYTVGFQPTASGDGKWHALELRVAKPNLTIRTRGGYIAQSQK